MASAFERGFPEHGSSVRGRPRAGAPRALVRGRGGPTRGRGAANLIRGIAVQASASGWSETTPRRDSAVRQTPIVPDSGARRPWHQSGGAGTPRSPAYARIAPCGSSNASTVPNRTMTRAGSTGTGSPIESQTARAACRVGDRRRGFRTRVGVPDAFRVRPQSRRPYPVSSLPSSNRA